jgi:hypothetical protein
MVNKDKEKMEMVVVPEVEAVAGQVAAAEQYVAAILALTEAKPAEITHSIKFLNIPPGI